MKRFKKIALRLILTLAVVTNVIVVVSATPVAALSEEDLLDTMKETPAKTQRILEEGTSLSIPVYGFIIPAEKENTTEKLQKSGETENGEPLENGNNAEKSITSVGKVSPQTGDYSLLEIYALLAIFSLVIFSLLLCWYFKDDSEKCV